MAELARCDYDFPRLSNEIAHRDTLLPTAGLVGDLRSDELQHWTPPAGGYHAALNHVVIHGLDVTVPLGAPRLPPDATIQVVLNDLTQGGVHEYFGIDIEGRGFEASDIDWTFGSGRILRGTAEDLALALCGRKLPDGRLQGAPLQRLEPEPGE